MRNRSPEGRRWLDGYARTTAGAGMEERLAGNDPFGRFVIESC